MAGKKGLGGIVWSGDDLGLNMVELAGKMDVGLKAIMTYEATEGQNYMRQNAPWTDRTGNARQGLFCRAYVGGSSAGAARKSAYVIVLYHTMPYGIWLETRWSGKYRIIEPAMQVVGNNVMQSANGLLRRLKGAA
jgi:hypothetical protein